MKKKNLIFASASFHPNRKNIIKKKKDLLQREEDYLFCLEQLFRVVPNDFEIHIVDNTIEGSDSLFNSELRSFLKDLNVTYSFETNKKEVKNIGVGELKELFYLENILKKLYIQITY